MQPAYVQANHTHTSSSSLATVFPKMVRMLSNVDAPALVRTSAEFSPYCTCQVETKSSPGPCRYTHTIHAHIRKTCSHY